jgi:hypothetical protein
MSTMNSRAVVALVLQVLLSAWLSGASWSSLAAPVAPTYVL